MRMFPYMSSRPLVLTGGGAGYNCGGGGGSGAIILHEPNPSYILPASVVTTWQCGYCDSLNKLKKLKCKNCGAPRRNFNE